MLISGLPEEAHKSLLKRLSQAGLPCCVRCQTQRWALQVLASNVVAIAWNTYLSKASYK